MKNNKIKLMVILWLMLGLASMHAQEVITSTGGDNSGSGGSVSYSVGQVIFITSTGTNGTVAQGVQQPFEIAVLTGLEEDNGITLQHTAYPNPVTEILTLRIEGEIKNQYEVSLYNSNGTRLEFRKIIGHETTIDMKNLDPATYYLKVTDKNKELKSFKIIKN